MKDLQMQLEKLSKICGVATAKTMSEVTGEEFISESVAISEANIKMIADYIQDGGYIVNCNCFQVEGRNIHGTMLFLVFEDDAKHNYDIIKKEGERVINTYFNALSETARVTLEIKHVGEIHDMLAAIIETAIVNYVTTDDELIVFGNEYIKKTGERLFSLFFESKDDVEKYFQAKGNEFEK